MKRGKWGAPAAGRPRRGRAVGDRPRASWRRPAVGLANRAGRDKMAACADLNQLAGAWRPFRCGMGAAKTAKAAKADGDSVPDPTWRKAGRVFCRPQTSADGLLFLDHRRDDFRRRHRRRVGRAGRRAARPVRRTAAARLRDEPAVVRARLRDVRNAVRGARQRGPRLPRAQRLAPRGRVLRGRSGERRLVGQHGRAGQAARHRPLLRRRRQQSRQLLRLDRAAHGESGDRQAVGRAISAGDRRGLGGRAGASGRPARHRAVGGGDGRKPRRHAGAGLGDPLSGAAAPRARHRRRAEPVRAEHRVQRGRAAGDPHRSRFPRRPLRRARAPSRAAGCGSRA